MAARNLCAGPPIRPEPDPEPMIAPRIPYSAWIYLAIAGLTLFDAFHPQAVLADITSVLIILFLILEIRAVSRAQMVVGVLLLAAGFGGAAISGDWAGVVMGGLNRSRVFLLLFFAVTWLQPPATQSPALRAARGRIVNQPPGRRFMALSLGVHGMGAILNLAGLGLLATVIQRSGDIRLRRRLTVALIQGFTSAACWSPFTVGMVVVLIALPTLTWRDVVGLGAVCALAIILGGLGADYLFHRAQPEAATAPPPPISAAERWRALAILGSLAGTNLVLIESAGISIPVALGMVGPVYGLVWYALMTGHPSAWMRRGREMAGQVMAQLSTLRGEVLVFVAANIFGLGVAAILPAEALGAAVDELIPWPDAKLAAIIGLFLLCGMAGLHPVVVVIFLTAVLPPAALGLDVRILGVTYLATWGMSSMVSPFSATTLYMSRLTGVPAHVIAWRWAAPAIVPSALAVGAWIIFVRHMGV